MSAEALRRSMLALMADEKVPYADPAIWVRFVVARKGEVARVIFDPVAK